jgi:hypothetical protein
LAVWLVADFDALSYQVTTNFDTSCAARIPTAPAINYTACCMLVFIIQIQLVTSFCKSNILSNQSALTLQRSTNLFCFLWVGKSQNRPYRRLLGLALLALWQALAVAWARGAWQCANK